MKKLDNACLICGHNESKYVIKTPVQMQKSEKLFSFHKCLNCGIVFLFNPPSNEEIGQYYSSNYLPYFDNNSWGKYSIFVKIGQNNIDKKRVSLVLKEIKKNEEEFKVLDFGCGNPTFLKKLKEVTKVSCTGFDINPLGWENKKKDYENINLISGDVSQLNTNTKFNLVTLWHALEHSFYPNELIKLIYKMTTDDATVVIEVPNYNSCTRWAQKKYWAGYHTPRHSVIYTDKTLKQLVENFGWNVEKIYKYGTMDSFTLWWLGHFEKITQKLNKSEIKLENYFWNFLVLKFLLFPIFLFEKFFSFGIMTVVLKKRLDLK